MFGFKKLWAKYSSPTLQLDNQHDILKYFWNTLREKTINRPVQATMPEGTKLIYCLIPLFRFDWCFAWGMEKAWACRKIYKVTFSTSIVESCCTLLCILTIKWVPCMQLAGWNKFFQCFSIFFRQIKGKRKNCLKGSNGDCMNH